MRGNWSAVHGVAQPSKTRISGGSVRRSIAVLPFTHCDQKPAQTCCPARLSGARPGSETVPLPLDVAGRLETLKRPCPVMNRQNLNLVGKEPVDNSVALHNDLPNIISAYLGDNTSYSGELSQTICGLE